MIKGRGHSKILDKYIAQAVLPYILLALFLFTAVLYAQQSSRFAELLLVARLPSSIAIEIALNLIPTILTFAVPTGVLTGMLIGFSRMGGDSEIVAMRAAGVGTWNIIRAPLAIGLVASLSMLYIGMVASPNAAETLRRVALRVALYKLDSPVDPKTFNTELPGKIIYVREGDQYKGEWGKVFIYSEDHNGETTFLTARAGRIDFNAEQSELVLSDAVRTVLPKMAAAPNQQTLVTERLEQLRVKLPTNRANLLARIRQEEPEPEEMTWRGLWNYSQKVKSKERLEVLIILNRRAALASAPLLFALLGTGLGLRIRRGGRGLGMIISLIMLFFYYLCSLGGEQIARAGVLPPALALWGGNILTLLLSWYLLSGNFKTRSLINLHWLRRSGKAGERKSSNQNSSWSRSKLGILALLDRYLLKSLAFYLLMALLGFIAIFLVFTVFELWKYVVRTGAGTSLIVRYLFYLVPLTVVSLASTSTLVAVLATYALLSRRSEALAWWASGQSSYRLALPGVFFAFLVGGGVWLVQERIMPVANQKQDSLRAQIRNGVAKTTTPVGRQWLASADGKRIYNFEYDERREQLIAPIVYEFDQQSVHLLRVVQGESARWEANSDILKVTHPIVFDLKTKREKAAIEPPLLDLLIHGVEQPSVFKPTLNKPSQLSSLQLSAYIQSLKTRGGASADLMVALAKKHSDPYSPVVMSLLGIPLALAFGRKSAIAALASAILIGLVFWGVAGGFQQLGAYGLLPAEAAAWSPALIFSTLGIYLLSKART